MKTMKFFALSFAMVLATTIAANSASAFELKGKPKIAILYNGPKNDGGWLTALDMARIRMQKSLGSKIAFTEGVKAQTSEIKTAAELYIRRGYNIILGTSFGFSAAFKELAAKYPNVAFTNAGGNTNGPNLLSYFGRSYETAYLCGMVAGGMSKSGQLGIVAAHPLGLVNWEVNAYLLGARKMNPDAKLRVIYIGDWSNAAKERNAALALIEAGADVIGQAEVNTPATQLAAQEKGIYSTGQHNDLSKVAPKATLCSNVWVWDKFLDPTVKQIVSGNWKPSKWGEFLGIKSGAIDIVLNEKLVTPAVKRKVMAARQEIIDGKHVFAGPIKDQAGKIVITAGKNPGDGALWGMKYLVEGVVGNLK